MIVKRNEIKLEELEMVFLAKIFQKIITSFEH